ncbi:Ferritin-like domain-containing protein [Chitinophaga jiangningensis]|uniref:Ferritin-like domain-containing protein n=1 Tax=Chitinophaga jiangningensis TaxID=1419482 RepID=A0A1M7EAP9_9BACT|nr:ferritin-like domain-containing protein [Chitinophaga jiangningensis]SHL88824.1 Ferritin-like domain-containing protein [Chitinophaga jiangningensis]
MDFINILQQIEKVDPEVYDKLDTRRDVMKRFTNISGKIALAAIPLALGSMFNKAYATTSSAADVYATLNFALTLEYLEAEFYTKGVAAPNLIPAAETTAFNTIKGHEVAHVEFLKSALMGAGATPVAKPTFDFTAGGVFADVFTNYDTFLALSQAFEDTGVRAYKGQAGVLLKQGAVLTAALGIHAVEARHAAHVRMVRSKRLNNDALKPWITQNTSFIGVAAANAVYAGENNGTQANVNIATTAKISSDAATEAFDEPLTRPEVEAIAKLFIKA